MTSRKADGAVQKKPVLLSARPLRNSSAHKLPFFQEHVHCHVVFFLFGAFVLGFVVLLLVCCFGFAFCRHLLLDVLDCVMVHALFRRPKEGSCCTLTIRTMAQTLCYDLARAEKAKDGKKMAQRVNTCITT